jgi:hypothetical protein
MKKNLLPEAAEVLIKARETAYKYERFEKLYEVIKNERRYVKMSEPANVDKIENLNKELIEISEKLKINSGYTYLNDKTIALMNRFGITESGFQKDKFDVILNSELMQNADNAKTFYSKIYYHQILGAYYFMVRKYDKAFENYKIMLDIYECNMNLFNENLKNYILVLQNCVHICDILRLNKDYRMYYNKFTGVMREKAHLIPGNLKSYIISRSLVHLLRRLTVRGNFNTELAEFKYIIKRHYRAG